MYIGGNIFIALAGAFSSQWASLACILLRHFAFGKAFAPTSPYRSLFPHSFLRLKVSGNVSLSSCCGGTLGQDHGYAPDYDVRIYIWITNIQAQTTSMELVNRVSRDMATTSIASIAEREDHRHGFALKTTWEKSLNQDFAPLSHCSLIWASMMPFLYAGSPRC